MNDPEGRKKGGKVASAIWIAIGTISLGLGMIGIFLPLLPTTPFLLLTAACYCKGSEKMHKWLLEHKVFGSYIRDYQEKKGIKKRAKIIAISTLWASILFCMFYLDYTNSIPDEIFYVQVLLLVIAIGVTMHLLKLKTL